MRLLVEAGWAKHVDRDDGGECDYSFQLTTQALELLTVQFGLDDPFPVFQRRPDIALGDATTFELVMELQHMGFEHKEIGRKKKGNPYFAEGT